VDDIVKRAMAKWPAVPSVYGWLALDRRGRWLIKGEPIGNPLVAGFIGRNYGPDARGRWFFQNGPQRVFVTLAYTPLVYRYAEGALHSTTGRAAGALAGAWVDDTGQFVLDAAEGPGVLHDRDLEALLHDFAAPDGAPLAEDALAEALETLAGGVAAPLALRYRGALVPVAPLRAAEAPARFGFVPSPQPDVAEEACT
jgi:hypothetical protein